ncbi:hypothetical protein K7X08_028783 [Anisodus acutangulus]|uniref:Pentatricopeptide repeat-containing protein n=1 Tax=Anisodus acutangulus TaxID=402998 RepID=A0A9Q1KZE6_9SOLA|nr:hypothetical protein K7X08_028783 [Anisodus acutangulus]
MLEQLLLTEVLTQAFDAVLLEIHSSLKPLNVLKIFHIGSGSCGFKFNVRSYCTLLRLLVASNHDDPARLLLIRLIDGKLPALFDNPQKKHVEVAAFLAELSCVSDFGVAVRTFDLLVHLCCTQFKNVGFDAALDVFRSLASRGLYPSLKTSNFLLSSLVKESELRKSYEVFGVLNNGVKPDVYLFSTTINAFCKGGPVDEAKEILRKMEKMGAGGWFYVAEHRFWPSSFNVGGYFGLERS